MYLLRLDDASEHWDREKWENMHDLLMQYGIKPIFAVIPHNEDPKLLNYPEDPKFLQTVHSWIAEGWTPALHGFSHVLSPSQGGLNPVNTRSEFCGKPLEEQKTRLRNGYRQLADDGITPELFVAPAHTFDENTLTALKTETPIRIISDTVADDVYYEDGFYFVPQQSGTVRKLKAKTVTFCYHPNTATDSQMQTLEQFLKQHQSEFGSFQELALTKRKKNFRDRLMSRGYFLLRRIRGVLHR